MRSAVTVRKTAGSLWGRWGTRSARVSTAPRRGLVARGVSSSRRRREGAGDGDRTPCAIVDLAEWAPGTNLVREVRAALEAKIGHHVSSYRERARETKTVLCEALRGGEPRDRAGRPFVDRSTAPRA